MKSITPLLSALLLALLTPCPAADLTLAGIFTDHTVLQRGVPVPVWGWGDPNEKVTVTFAGQRKAATADAHGKWIVRLDPMQASAEARELMVESAAKDRKSRISDVVVGDVWLCSGQSNMRFQLSRTENAREEIAAANHPAVRFLMVDEQFSLKSMENAKGTWAPVTPATAAECSAVAYYFGRALQEKVGVPIGLMVSSVGGTRIETWMRPETLASVGVSGSLVDRWKAVSPEEFEKIGAAYRAFQDQRDRVHPQAVREAKSQGAAAPPAPEPPKMRCHDCPSALHNGMILPLQPFAIRGVIWYQGESNSGQAASYEKLLPAMISDWRQVWGAKLPFLFVQLAPHRNTHPAFREAQHRISQKTPHTAMVVTTDVGDANDIHPTRKRPVGERLALAARALSYQESVEYSGPVFAGMKVENDRAVISFTHAGSGLVASDGELRGFTLAGADAKFVPARAVIEGSTVTVTADTIRKPVAVRYAWAMVPDANLFNREGLPAVPFRTDAPASGARATESP
jgi:sialate O-acetylesterase